MRPNFYALIIATFLSAQTAPAPKSAATTHAAETSRVARILQNYVDQKKVAGVVALVLRDGQPAFGWSAKKADRRVTTSTLFRIASQSKAFTSTAVLALLEEGKIGINEPVSHFISSFTKTTVLTKDNADGQPVAAKGAIIIAGLLTHTAGISYGTEPQVANLYREKGFGLAGGNGWYFADKDEPVRESILRLGAYGALYQVDPQSHLVTVLMLRLMPNATDIKPKFMTLVYQAVAN